MERTNRSKQTNRSRAWRDKKTAPTNSREEKKATENSPPSDEPLYDLGPHEASMPATQIYCQNFDCSGFIDLNERIYEDLKGLDPTLEKVLPYSMFLHHNCTVLNAALIDVSKANGEQLVPDSIYAQDLLPGKVTIPKAVEDYCTLLSNCVTASSDKVRINIPRIAVPRVTTALAAQGEQPRFVIPPGTFGPVSHVTHNVYECYISPYVTAGRVLASRDGNADWDPLPPEIIPQDATPTENLLGYGVIDYVPPDAQSRLEGLVFPTTDDLAGRLQICQELMMRVSRILERLASRYKMTELGLVNSVRKRIIPKTSSANLIFAESPTDTQLRLSMNQANLWSGHSFGSAQAGQANIMVMHRRRTEKAPGCCYLRDDQIIPGWIETRNSNYLMEGEFGPRTGRAWIWARDDSHVSYCPVGVRTTAIYKWLNTNYMINDNF